MEYKAYKGREIDLTKPVKVYKNLHNGMFSVQQDGKVVAHVSTIDLVDVTFKVSEAGRQRVLTERKKNVHAFVVGLVVDVNAVTTADTQCRGVRVSYNPYKSGKFLTTDPLGRVAKVYYDEQLHCSSSLGLFII